jgi:peptidoglycan/xylan/chitin deacetylase (PgdA/CDA1 family)
VRHHREQWRNFASAVAATVVALLVVGVVEPALGGRGGTSRPAVALGADDGAASPAGGSPATTSAGTAPVPTTRPGPTTTNKPAPTTTVPKPGFGLLPQPTPTPVALPPTNLAPAFSRIPTTNKVIFLGIDDGMVRDPAVLDYLQQAKIPFTNFLVQSQAVAGEDFWKQAQALGGTVESHTITHPDLTKVSAAQLQSEVCGTLDDYQQRFGVRPTLFRPPYGALNDNVRAVAASCGYKAVVMWQGSTNDGRFDLQAGTQLTPGDVVLMHWRADLLGNLQKVVQTCKEQGFTIARLEDYLR